MRRPSPALVIAVLALFISLGGVTYAATLAPRNSVASTSIRTGAVTGAKVASRAITQSRIAPGAVGPTRLADRAVTSTKLGDGAVTSTKLGDGVVTSTKLGDGAVSGGKVADKSLTGADIDVASLPVIHSITQRQVNGTPQDVAINAPAQTTAACLPGETVVGGGASAGSGDLVLNASAPQNNGWTAVYYNKSAATIRLAQVVAYAFCAT